ncbi:MAG: arginyltransferase [Helicobacteraceae bacterium]
MKDLQRIYEFVATDKPCPYIAGKKSDTKYFWIENCSVGEYDKLLQRGYRRFGKLFFNPICSDCFECLSVRINVKDFVLRRSFKRVLNKNRDVKVLFRRPSLTKAHLDLHQKYHSDMNLRRNWNTEETTREHYYSSFVDGYMDYGYEFLYVLGGKIIGVALVDVLPEGVSAIYCFYDPDHRDRSIGTFSILNHINFCLANGLQYVYLGYWVRENISLKYKEKFKPFEVLAGRPDLNTPAIWERYD